MIGLDGTLRFDLVGSDGTDHWFLVISNGDVRVSRECRDADCVVRVDRMLFDQIMTGEANALASFLGHRLTVEGQLLFFTAVKQTFPGPRAARHPRSLAPEGRRRT
nr:SCP2 sterol-binding domain-containing protein [Planosporangium thailandense]